MSLQNWKNHLSSAFRRYEFIASVVFLAVVLFVFTQFLNFVELREGSVLTDPLLSLFNPVDVTWLTFAVIYISLTAAVFSFIKKPEVLLLAVQVYTVMVILRTVAMYLLPLNPPASMIPLADPFVEFFGTGQLMTKDLFFSGHTATIFLLYLVSPRGKLKLFLFAAAFLIALLVVIQHVHYTIDVFAAPVFTYAAYRITLNIKSAVKSNHNI